jgi:hypothetical protein
MSFLRNNRKPFSPPKDKRRGHLPRIQWEIVTKGGQKFYILGRTQEAAKTSALGYGIKWQEIVSALPYDPPLI